MLAEYIQAAMDRAEYEILEDDGTYYASIPGFKGVWANAETLEECRRELQEVLEEWILLGISLGHRLPTVAGLRIKAPRTPKRAAG
jgi:predicted RNase H-like HicB family nuclease